ncbi:MAG TPA: hypothetical protein VGO91_06720 [Pyrinomonadaceae bacterium]|jgi:hypothetical protein|nr:hypothetical protein [Pyrinomonadaceae bacterium]
MTAEDEPKNDPDDDESARRAAAEELQEQIDALVRGEAGARSEKPHSLREFIERGGSRPPRKPQDPRGDAPDDEPHLPDEAGGDLGESG